MSEIVKALKAIEKELEMCYELFEEINNIADTSPISKIVDIKRAFRQNEDNNNEDIDIKYEDAVKMINERLQRCIKLVESLQAIKFKVRTYMPAIKSINVEDVLRHIARLIMSHGLRSIRSLKHVETKIEVSNIKLSEDVLREIDKKFESGEYYE